MKVLSTGVGLVFIFDSLRDLSGVIDHLLGMKEWAESEKIDPPFLYSIFHDSIPRDDIEELLNDIKSEGETKYVE